MLRDFNRVNLLLTYPRFRNALSRTTCPEKRLRGKERAPAPAPIQKKACPEEHAFECIYRYGTAKSRYFTCLERAATRQHYFTCLAFFVLSPFFELIAAFTAPINAGATDTATMPKTMTSKWSCTNGMPPKK